MPVEIGLFHSTHVGRGTHAMGWFQNQDMPIAQLICRIVGLASIAFPTARSFARLPRNRFVRLCRSTRQNETRLRSAVA
jgi:hypothetical protein